MKILIVSSLKETMIKTFDGYIDDNMECHYLYSQGKAKHYFEVKTTFEESEICYYLQKVLKIKEPYKTISAAYKFFLIK